MEEKHAGFVPRAYNDGMTIAYGFDMYLYPEVKINYNPDGTVSEEGKKNMPSIRMDFRLWKESCHGEKKIYFYQHHHIVHYPD